MPHCLPQYSDTLIVRAASLSPPRLVQPWQLQQSLTELRAHRRPTRLQLLAQGLHAATQVHVTAPAAAADADTHRAGASTPKRHHRLLNQCCICLCRGSRTKRQLLLHHLQGPRSPPRPPLRAPLLSQPPPLRARPAAKRPLRQPGDASCRMSWGPRQLACPPRTTEHSGGSRSGPEPPGPSPGAPIGRTRRGRRTPARGRTQARRQPRLHPRPTLRAPPPAAAPLPRRAPPPRQTQAGPASFTPLPTSEPQRGSHSSAFGSVAASEHSCRPAPLGSAAAAAARPPEPLEPA